MPNRRLMRIHVEALFAHDDRGRMVRVNEPEHREAPRFFLGRTSDGNVWSFRHDVPDEVRLELESACLAEPPGEEFLLPPYGATRYEQILARSGPIQRTSAGPAYWIPDDLPESPDTVQVTEDNSGLLRPHLEDWLPDVAARRPFVACAVLIDGRAVSICCSVRTTGAAHEAGVETAPGFRARGCAMRAVAAWARTVRAMGAMPLYSTSWQNVASQALARKLGLRRYGADLHIT
ncbi:MAG: GNAT family N-acetyltransferase [Phycisphaerae bacterium]